MKNYSVREHTLIKLGVPESIVMNPEALFSGLFNTKFQPKDLWEQEKTRDGTIVYRHSLLGKEKMSFTTLDLTSDLWLHQMTTFYHHNELDQKIFEVKVIAIDDDGSLFQDTAFKISSKDPNTPIQVSPKLSEGMRDGYLRVWKAQMDLE